MDFQTLTLELQKQCLDLGQMKYPGPRYGEVLNRALAQYPRVLWPRNLDGTSLDTVEDQHEYDLSGISAIVEPWQVLRVWIDDSSGAAREIGRYEIQDNAGSLSLVLDEAPAGSRDITLEYASAPASMSDPTDTTEVDDHWLLARAMIALLGEADWEVVDPQRVVAYTEYWNALLVTRERQLVSGRRRTGRRARTNAWRKYV